MKVRSTKYEVRERTKVRSTKYEVQKETLLRTWYLVLRTFLRRTWYLVLRTFPHPRPSLFRTSYFVLRTFRPSRHAITLLEVLMSMFVLAVGLLSVASLLPVGTFQATRAC